MIPDDPRRGPTQLSRPLILLSSNVIARIRPAVPTKSLLADRAFAFQSTVLSLRCRARSERRSGGGGGIIFPCLPFGAFSGFEQIS